MFEYKLWLVCDVAFNSFIKTSNNQADSSFEAIFGKSVRRGQIACGLSDHF